MSEPDLLNEVIARALRLSLKERIQVIERLASSVEREMDVQPQGGEPRSEHWGENLIRRLDEVGPIDLVHPEIDDPVEWVKQIRREQEVHRRFNWEQDE